MQIHRGRAAVATLVLAELGALAGTTLCTAFLAGWVVLRHGLLDGQTLLGTLVWGAACGLAAAVALVSGPAIWPVPLLVPALGVGGLLAGVVAARRSDRARTQAAISEDVT